MSYRFKLAIISKSYYNHEKNKNMFPEVQRKAQHPGDIGDESVAWCQVEGHRRLGRGGEARNWLASLRGQSRRRNNERSWSFEVWNASKTRCRSWFRLGILRVKITHTLQCQIWWVIFPLSLAPLQQIPYQIS